MTLTNNTGVGTMQSAAELPDKKKSFVRVLTSPLVSLLATLGKLIVRLFLPKQSKRVVCLVSVYQHLVSMDLLPKMGVAELNQLLKISRDDNALNFPVEYYNRIWDARSIREAMVSTGVLNSDNAVCNLNGCLPRFCTELAFTTPPCLHYGPIQKIAEDILNLINKVEAAGPEAKFA